MTNRHIYHESAETDRWGDPVWKIEVLDGVAIARGYLTIDQAKLFHKVLGSVITEVEEKLVEHCHPED